MNSSETGTRDRKSSPAWRVALAVALGGACATGGQAVLLRELLATFQGNELSLGAVLAAWLFWGALGSWLIGGRADRFRRPAFLLAITVGITALLLPATVFATAFVKRGLGASPFESVNFFLFLPATAILLGPLCLVQGGLFAIGAKALGHAASRNEVSLAYLLESAGAGFGGLVISFWAMPRMTPMALSFALGEALLAVAFLLSEKISSGRPGKVMRLALLFSLVAFAGGAIHPGPEHLRRRMQWHGARLLEARNSLFGNLAAIEMDGQISIYENGFLAVTSGTHLHAEELAHIGIVQHPAPRTALLLGGALGGVLREALKHPLMRCDCVELDPELFAIARRRFPASDLLPLVDPRVVVHHLDGRYFVKNTSQRYDVILLDLPSPSSAQLNRFYSLEFFREVRRVLNPEGVFCFGLPSSEVRPSQEQARLLASLLKTAREVFPHVALLPGDTCHFLLSISGPLLTDADAIQARLDALKIAREHLHEHYLKFRLLPWRAVQFRSSIEEKEREAQTNRDFRPMGYLYELVQWSAQFPGPLRGWVERLACADMRWAYLIPGSLLLSGIIAMGVSRLSRKRSLCERLMSWGIIPVAVAVTGASEIVFQVTVLIGFQVIYGYLFHRIGIMVAAFMLGLAGGSYWIWRREELSAEAARRGFIWVHAGVAIYPLLLPLFFTWQPKAEMYMFLPIVAGLLGGVEFPLAVRLMFSRTGGATAGVLYGLDLFGACVGAAVVVPFMIPLMGLAGVCCWTALLNLAILSWALQITP